MESTPLSAVLFGQQFHPQLVVAAFVAELGNAGAESSFLLRCCSYETQKAFVDKLLSLYPTTSSNKLLPPAPQEYIASVARAFIKLIEDLRKHLQAQRTAARNGNADDDDANDKDDDDDPLSDWDDELIAMASLRGNSSSDEKFRQLLLFVANGGDAGGGGPPSSPLVFAVGPQFENVGLSLWPAAAVLTELLLSPSLLVGDARNVVVELGAGIGVTGAAFERSRSAASTNARFVLTDYQQEILDLGERNLNLNRAAAASSSVPPCCSYALLDWTEDERNAAFFGALMQKDEQLNLLVCGADIIYDAPYVGPLASTIATAFEQVEKHAAPSSTISVVIVHTLRNPETLELFRRELAARGLHLEVSPVQESPASQSMNARLAAVLDGFFTSGDGEGGDSNASGHGDAAETAAHIVMPVLRRHFAASRDNVLRAQQGGHFYAGALFAKMSAQLLLLRVQRGGSEGGASS